MPTADLPSPKTAVLEHYPHAFASRKGGDDRWAVWEGPKPATADGPAGRVLGQSGTAAGAWRDAHKNLQVYQDPMNQAIAHDLERMGEDPAPWGPGYAQLGALLTAKQRVRQQYPAALAYKDDDGWTVVERPARENVEFDHRRVLGEGRTGASAWQAAADNLPDAVTTDAEGRRVEMRYKLALELQGKSVPDSVKDIYPTQAAYYRAALDAATGSLSDFELYGPLTVTEVPKGPATTPPKPRIAFSAERARTLSRYGRQKRNP